MISEQLRNAFQLRKDKRNAEAVEIYNGLYPQYAADFGEWDAWSFGQCLNACRQHSRALEICREFYPKFKQSEIFRQLYAWTIFYTEFGHEEVRSLQETQKAGKAILQLSPPGNKYSPSVMTVFRVLKKYASVNNPDWNQIGEWLSKLDKARLNQEPYTMAVPGKRNVELASELEEWYSWKTKYLLQVNEWQECVDVCDEALTTLKKWHYSNDIWFARRKAAALKHLMRKEEARLIVEGLVRRKPDWFIIADLADLTEDDNEAIVLLCRSLLAHGEWPMKLRVFSMMVQRLIKIGEKEIAADHMRLDKAIRLDNGWEVSNELEKSFGMKLDNEVEEESADLIIRRLRQFWLEKTSVGNINEGIISAEKFRGSVYSLLANGEAGFIKPDKGQDNIYFLFRHYRGPKDEIKPGLKVIFEVTKSFDKKKNKDSFAAVRIRKA